MKEPEHGTEHTPETKPEHDEVAKKAYAIYVIPLNGENDIRYPD